MAGLAVARHRGFVIHAFRHSHGKPVQKPNYKLLDARPCAQLAASTRNTNLALRLAKPLTELQIRLLNPAPHVRNAATAAMAFAYWYCNMYMPGKRAYRKVLLG
jgi:hypothetical protein